MQSTTKHFKINQLKSKIKNVVNEGFMEGSRFGEVSEEKKYNYMEQQK